MEQRAFTPSQCGKSQPIPVPAWLNKELPEMSKNITWQQSSNNGTQYYSEAQMWQKAFGMVQEFLSLAKGTISLIFKFSLYKLIFSVNKLFISKFFI